MAGDDRDGLGGIADVALFADGLVRLGPGQAPVAWTARIAAVSVVLPWSMWPIVPTLTWTFSMGTFSRSPRSGDRSGDGPFVPIVSDLFTTPSGTRESRATTPGSAPDRRPTRLGSGRRPVGGCVARAEDARPAFNARRGVPRHGHPTKPEGSWPSRRDARPSHLIPDRSSVH